MELKYKVVSTFKPGEGREGTQIWFPKLTGSSPVDLLELGEILAERSTVSPGDVYTVIIGLMGLIPELLLQGNTIKMDRLGSFRLHARVETSESPEQVSARNIKELRLSFKPSGFIKDKLRMAKIVPEKG